jgi:hypothetical protein
MLSTPPQTRGPTTARSTSWNTWASTRRGARHVHTGAYNHTRGNARTATTNVPMPATSSTLPADLDANAHHRGRRRPQLLPVLERQLGNAEWPFDSPQYLILNIAVGGDWGGQKGVNDAMFPVRDAGRLRARVPAIRRCRFLSRASAVRGSRSRMAWSARR